MARDNLVPGFSSITQNGPPQARSNDGLIRGQNVRRYPQHCSEAQEKPNFLMLDKKTGNYVAAGKEIHEAVLRALPVADVGIEAPSSPGSRTPGPVQERKPSQVSNIHDRHPKIDQSECPGTDSLSEIPDHEHDEDDDEEDPSQDMSDVEGECLIEHRRHPVRADQIEHFTKMLFRYGVQQKGCKKVLQHWLRKCHPKKQATHPYNGGHKQEWTDPENKGELTAPPYWPKQKDWLHAETSKGVRHKEPDHLLRPERLVLCGHLLTWGNAKGFDFSVDILEESTEKLTDKYPDHFLPAAGEHLADIYELRRHQMRFENGEIDGNSTLLILMPHKAKIHHIQITVKPRQQQLPKKARPAGAAIKPKVRSPSTTTSELDSAFHGHGPLPRRIKMETETVVSRSSSLHAGPSTPEQSADDDEDMTTEPCSSLPSPMATDTPIEAGNGSSFGHDSYTCSCRSESYDMPMKYQPVTKAEEQQFSQTPWNYGNAGMQTDTSLASSSAHVPPQHALQNHVFDHGSYDPLGANNVFGAMPGGSQNAGISSGGPRLGSPGYGEDPMFNPWPPPTDGCPNGVVQGPYASPHGSHTSPYDANPFNLNLRGFQHLRDPAWFKTYTDMQDYSSNMDSSGYDKMDDTRMFSPA